MQGLKGKSLAIAFLCVISRKAVHFSKISVLYVQSHTRQMNSFLAYFAKPSFSFPPHPTALKITRLFTVL